MAKSFYMSQITYLFNGEIFLYILIIKHLNIYLIIIYFAFKINFI